VLAALVVWGAYGDRARDVANLGAPAPVPEATVMQGLLVEGLIAFLLVFTVVAVATDPRVPEGVQPVAIGFALAAGVLIGGPVSGGAGNPARALGPMIVTGTFGDWLIYVAGPILGAIVAALLYDRFIATASAPTTAVASESSDGEGHSGDDER
ncbi:MAG: aquaporin, partial [Chloroflexia bacterium]|nr:aquaporin [Chloroflexia bacterium]